jgi:16S rRNA (uracil1498-N3)-methyltransferase
MSGSCTTPLFFHDAPLVEKSRIEITGSEAGHILQSRRLSLGDEITLADGKGLSATAVIERVKNGQRSLIANIIRVEKICRSPVRRILAAAIPKGDRQAVLLNMATQLGMDEYWPLHCDRSVVRFQDKMRERWHRLIVGACKQSRQFYFPTVGSEKRIDNIIANESSQRLVVVGDVKGLSIFDVKKQLTEDILEILMLIGPEGGFSTREQELLEQKNILKLRLGNQILRTETASVSLLATVNQLI